MGLLTGGADAQQRHRRRRIDAPTRALDWLDPRIAATNGLPLSKPARITACVNLAWPEVNSLMWIKFSEGNRCFMP